MVLYLSAKVPFADSDSAEVGLLDETDAGYFVLLAGDAKAAYFVRRDLVKAVKFARASEPPQAGPAEKRAPRRPAQ